MNRFLIIIACALMSISKVAAQDCGCYTSTREQAVQLMSQGKYTKAITFLQAAKDCPDKPASHDLDKKIQECRDAIKRIEDNKKKEEAERQRREQEARWAKKAYMQIESIKFGNTTKSNDIINEFGSTLYAGDVQYLSAKLNYTGLSSASKSLTLYIKIFKPDGTMMGNSSSPAGYTYSANVHVYPGAGKVLDLGGYGSSSGTSFVNGNYRWEIWYNNSKVYESIVSLMSKYSDNTYLTVDGKSAVSTSFSSSGGSEVFYVSTNASSWTTWGVPTWCKINNKTSTSFTIQCDPNTSSSSRSDYMKIKAGNKEVKIDIKQSGDSKVVSAVFNSVRVDYDVYESGSKGMRIHVNFNINNAKGVPYRCVAYFYFSNGTALKDYNGLYKTNDGKVSVGTDIKPGYDNSLYSDLQLFIPYSELHLSRNTKHNCYFEVNLYRKSDSKFLPAEHKESFIITY